MMQSDVVKKPHTYFVHTFEILYRCIIHWITLALIITVHCVRWEL
jgi:hypothetical protein